MSTLEGKTKIKKTKVVVDYFIGILIELIDNNQELILCMGIMFINQQELFTKTDKYIRFGGLVTLTNRKK